VRHKKHLVYKLANGKTLTLSKTPGDPNNVFNGIRYLRRLVEET
jgi:hypothetical protein